MVAEDFSSDDVSNTKLQRKMLGSIITIDAEGDAAVLFEGHSKQVWAFKKHFGNLVVLQDVLPKQV